MSLPTQPKRRGRPPKNLSKLLGNSPAPRPATSQNFSLRHSPYDKPRDRTFERPPRSFYERQNLKLDVPAGSHSLQTREVVSPVAALAPFPRPAANPTHRSPLFSDDLSFSPGSSSNGSSGSSSSGSEATGQPRTITKFATKSRAPRNMFATPPASTTSSAMVVKWTSTDLWKHLQECDGIVRPISKNTETRFGWEKLFLAVGAEPPRYKLDSEAPTEVTLAMDGQVLCHLANLYAIGAEAHHMDSKTGALRSGACETWLGEFSWTVSRENRRSVQLTCAPRRFRANSRHPLRPFSSIKMPANGKAIDTYVNALAMGVSDASYEWPPFPSPLGRWINAMARNLSRLSSHRPERGCVIITPTWLEMVKFSRWLMCFDGSANHGFLQDVMRELDRRDFIRSRAQSLLSSSNTAIPPANEIRARDGPTGKFLIDAFSYTIDPNVHYRIVDEDDVVLARKSETQAVRDMAADILVRVLSSYDNETPNSWKRTLFECRDSVCAILMAGMKIPVDKGAVTVIPFDMESGFWEMKDISVDTIP